MAGIYPQYRKGEDKPYAYNIRVYRGNSKKPLQMTWRIPDGLKSERKIQQELMHVVGAFESACGRGEVRHADKQTVKEYLDYYLGITGISNKTKAQDFNVWMQPLIVQYLGDIQLRKLTARDLNEFYSALMTEPVRRDLKARAKDKLLRIKAERKISHAMLCQMAGLSDNTIRLMCQQKNVAVLSAQKAAKALDMPVEELFEVFSLGGDQVGLGVKSVREYHNFLHSMLQNAMDEDIISKNPADSAKPPKMRRKEAEWLELEDVRKIRNAIKNEPLRYRIMLQLLMECGMRKGELVGIQWRDIDGELIYIRRNIQWSPSRGGLYIESPKSGHSRVVTITPQLMRMLEEYRDEQDAFAKMRSSIITDESTYNPEGWLFPQEEGDMPMHPSSLNIWLKKVEQRYQLPHIYPHMFRHSQASLLYSANVDPLTISKRLGHEQMSTTQNIYAHLLRSMDRQAAEAIGRLLYGDDDNEQ